LRTIVLVVLVLIAIASAAVIGVRAYQIYDLAASITDEELDFSEVDVKVTAAGESLDIATFIPLVQAFAGTSFTLEGTTSPPSETAVSTSGFSFALTGPLLQNGWAFSQVYDDGNTATALI